MASSKNKPANTKPTIQAKKVIVMRKNQKVARVSLYCKLNMLVPQLKNLSARMQTEAGEKGRNSANNHQ
ncbi:hypothetical protein [uncultured Pontibacter sp.]|uniref:hypothetical protein n=1 Tax=uncultured Pontibacter sp. TaxID=453356 RepID=UPI002601D2B2|nr:hypothetical protein [uncultured Pontibacter sp.]